LVAEQELRVPTDTRALNLYPVAKLAMPANSWTGGESATLDILG